jgi:hypothetical protein
MHGAGQRNVHRTIAQAEDRFRDLAQQQTQAPGGNQRIEGPAVERPDHDPFDHEAKDRTGHDRERDGRQVRKAAGLRHVRAISADHDEFAVRDIEHAKQAENHRKPERKHCQRGDAVKNVDRLGDDQRVHDLALT